MRRILSIIFFTFVICVCPSKMCIASDIPLHEDLSLDYIIAHYNEKYGESKVGIVLKNKVKVGNRKEGGGLYAYSLNGRNDQVLRFYTNAKDEVLGMEIILHKYSPIMRECVENLHTRRISGFMWYLFASSGSARGIERNQQREILTGLDALKYYNNGEGNAWFINNNRKYRVEKSFDNSMQAVKILVYVEGK